MTQERARQILGKDFIGSDELFKVRLEFGFGNTFINDMLIPGIEFDEDKLIKEKGQFVLVLYYPFLQNGDFITLISLRNRFGVNPSENEPCFYNQDWYLHENFANTPVVKKAEWFLIRKNILQESRGLLPELVSLDCVHDLPFALVISYTFFVYKCLTGLLLWQNDFIWCRDLDNNGDRIYVGRYIDPAGIAKNGFSIHRHLSISPNYGCL